MMVSVIEMTTMNVLSNTTLMELQVLYIYNLDNDQAADDISRTVKSHGIQGYPLENVVIVKALEGRCGQEG